jgi:perosamine synthetase
VQIRIPQVSPWLDAETAESVAAVVRGGWITEGPLSREFSERLNALIGAPYGVFAPNGTMALSLGLMALEVQPGDEVLVPDITFHGSAAAVAMVGAIPIFTEVDPECFQIDLESAHTRLTERTRAIMPVHLYGTACDMEAINSFAQSYDLKVIEDAAQGIGVMSDGRHVGSLGDVGCFSFFADKTITTGEGGYVACGDPAIYKRLRLLRNQGRLDRGSFIHPAVGYNFRITEMQSALGIAQLSRLEKIVQRKAQLIARYRDRLSGIHQARILGPAARANQVPFRCVLMAEDAKGLMAHLEQQGIQPRTSFYPLHRQPGLRAWSAGRIPESVFEDHGYRNANYSWDHGVCLPIYPALTEVQVDEICDAIRAFYRR